ncbi:hypothetical protein [Neptunomonas sp.]|uniref:hypothetical protein n=1 Tax=Neptunomonas sp. TaxID=1971898 RepID=UPI0035658FBC
MTSKRKHSCGRHGFVEKHRVKWEAIRGLFTAVYKDQAKNIETIVGIWDQYRAGKLSLDKAREAINEHARGINEPEWFGHPSGISERSADSSYLGELVERSVSRQGKSNAG